jgi:hypothetical protein
MFARLREDKMRGARGTVPVLAGVLALVFPQAPSVSAAGRASATERRVLSAAVHFFAVHEPGRESGHPAPEIVCVWVRLGRARFQTKPADEGPNENARLYRSGMNGEVAHKVTPSEPASAVLAELGDIPGLATPCPRSSPSVYSMVVGPIWWPSAGATFVWIELRLSPPVGPIWCEGLIKIVWNGRAWVAEGTPEVGCVIA